MPTGMLCSECSAELDFGAPDGLCTRCLFQHGLAANLTPAPQVCKGNASLAEGVESRLRLVGDYELMEEIARGGMGVVYKARQVSMKRVVALKMITSGKWASPDMVRRFHIEAEAAGPLHHPNIVPIYEVGEDGGCHYFSMRLIEGPSLERVLDRGRRGDPACQLTINQSVHLIRKVALAIQYAHEHGVIHRDLKPGNILLDADDEPYITDFGLARILEQNSSLTASISFIGTAAYMSPEQASGRVKDLTPAGDIYGLGAILYELLTGQAPFLGRTPMETMRQVVELEPQRPRELNRDVDLDLETICLTCMEKNPGRRYPSAAAVADEMDRWLSHQPISARPSNPLNRTTKWIQRQPILTMLLAAISGAVLLGAFGFSSQSRRADLYRANEFRARTEANASQAQLSLARANAMLATGNEADALAILAHAVRRAPECQAAVERLLSALPSPRGAVPASHPFVHSSAVMAATFSPDGRLVATACTNGALSLWETERGRLVRTAFRQKSPVTSVHFSPDGTRLLAGAMNGSVQLLKVPSLLPMQTPPVHHGSVHAVNFSQDGRLFVSASMDGIANVFDSESGQLQTSVSHGSGILFANFSPDGMILVTTGLDASARLWEARSGLEIVPPASRQLDAIGFADFSQNGQWLVMACFDGTARLWDRKAKTFHGAVLNHLGGIRTVRFSPDGRLVVTASDDGRAGLWEVPTGLPHADSLQHDGPVISAQFSPDGRHVVTASVDGTARLWCASTGQLVGETIRHSGAVTCASFSPDGKRVLTGSLDGTACVWETTLMDSLAPPWLPSLAEAFAGKRWLGGELFETVPSRQLATVQASMNRAGRDDRATAWTQWAIGRSNALTVSPFSDLAVSEFVERCLKETNLASLRLAIQVDPGNALVLARLAVQCVRHGHVGEALAAGRQAILVDPESRDVWLAWSEVIDHSIGSDPKPYEILAVLDQFPADPRLWNLRGRLLERANRFGEAISAYDRALGFIRGDQGMSLLSEGVVVAARSRLLNRVDHWVPEAVRERQVTLGIPPRDPEAAANLVDLSAHYTASMTGNRLSFRDGSTDNLASLPSGVVSLEGISFDIRGVIQLSGSPSTKQVRLDESGIRVRQSCRRIQFLHGTEGPSIAGTTIGWFQVHCLSGQKIDLPLRYGWDVSDSWCMATDPVQGQHVVRIEPSSVPSKLGKQLRLYLTTWSNPNPDDSIETIDFRSAAAGSAPFLVAVTLE